MADENRILLSQIMGHCHPVDQLTDGELIDEVMEHVWSNLSMRSRESWLLGKLLGRFQQLAGIEETPQGITVDGNPVWPDVVSEE